MEQITLNMIPKGITPVCHASQYDKGRVIRLNIMDGLQGYVLSNESVQLNVRKPDMNIVTTDVDTTSGNTFVDIVTTEQMTACEGDNLCEIVLSAGDVVIASLNFIMRVEVDVLKDGIESETVIHDLKTTISDMIKEEIEAISPEEELSGAMASFETHEIAPLVDCKVKIEAVQSGTGTPSPDNVRPITGFTECNVTRTGKNLINPTLSPDRDPRTKSVRVTKGYDNVILTTTAAEDYMYYAVFYSLKKGTYTFKYQANSSDSYTPITTLYKIGSVVIATNIVPNTARTFTLTEDTLIEIRMFASTVGNGEVGRVVTFYEMQLELGTTATDYELYNGEKTTIDFNGNTVYYGTLDVTTGVLTIDYAGITYNGTETWSNYSSGNGYAISIPDMKSGTHYSDEKALCNEFEKVSDNSNLGIRIGVANKNIYIVQANTLTGVSDLATWYTWLSNNNLTVVYPLETPLTIQLTPTEIKTILGVNNIWADTGDIDVVYHHELTARYVYFDNTGTDLTATNVEAAIKELWSRLQ